MLKQFRLTRRYEKPFLTRRRLSYEKAKAIYDEDMSRKIKFVMKKNRMEPWLTRRRLSYEKAKAIYD